ncbi:hypothetical protein SLE2022_201990 [Rubroshorea leprosula]
MQLFSKPLSQTDVEVRFSVPMESLEAFGIPEDEYKINFEAMDINGKPWQFRLSKRKRDNHPKPVFSAGWLAFAQQKRLRKNDKLVLHADDLKGNKKQYRIQALRTAFRLLGQDIWVDVEKFEKDDNDVIGVTSAKFLLHD